MRHDTVLMSVTIGRRNRWCRTLRRSLAEKFLDRTVVTLQGRPGRLGREAGRLRFRRDRAGDVYSWKASTWRCACGKSSRRGFSKERRLGLRTAGAAAGPRAGAHGRARHHRRPADAQPVVRQFAQRTAALEDEVYQVTRRALRSVRPSSSATYCSARWACPSGAKADRPGGHQHRPESSKSCGGRL